MHISTDAAGELAKVRRDRFERLLAEDRLEDALMCIQRPRRLALIQRWHAGGLLSQSKLVAEWWSDTESPWQYGVPAAVRLFELVGL